ncbi:Fur family ferric uptake transcriptional regulator [Variovorax sp. TBS-050B]|uniref:Fur family transcriptional regulator n=1 Tax=Variovorax sp. TBS-050B TaxID=2940551 RepID=UPI0024769AE7|nr:transcriptional repressor [Variovorax sp. TBS-050B]MDH6590391.1 Fur family ferric uptake transcriptional regulator [Variovorax sp. TBS-050B]
MAASPSTRIVSAQGLEAPAVTQRGTRQKAAIRAVIDGAARPLLPQEILEAAQQEVAALSIATVYRNLKLLAEAGQIRSVELPGEAPRYESARHGHHHHFQCRSCSRVFDVHACPGDFSELAPKGFRVESHELTLYGQCADCRKRAAPAAGAAKKG